MNGFKLCIQMDVNVSWFAVELVAYVFGIAGEEALGTGDASREMMVYSSEYGKGKGGFTFRDSIQLFKDEYDFKEAAHISSSSKPFDTICVYSAGCAGEVELALVLEGVVEFIKKKEEAMTAGYVNQWDNPSPWRLARRYKNLSRCLNIKCTPVPCIFTDARVNYVKIIG